MTAVAIERDPMLRPTRRRMRVRRWRWRRVAIAGVVLVLGILLALAR
ncbi:MAG TPA: hypothetical protein VFQ53_13145 [Kofleriaceae bacterium]|nr:hypothetical protein [Kofleriaceae bacterium]